jgi:hypothetical protein
MKIVKPSRVIRTYTQRLVADGSAATITCFHTSLGAAGEAFVASFTEDDCRRFMQDWEARMNHYLRHGSALDRRRQGRG